MNSFVKKNDNGKSTEDAKRDGKPRKKIKVHNCIVPLCFTRRIKFEQLFCEHHWLCVPALVRQRLLLLYQPHAKRQSKEFIHIATKAREFASDGKPK